MDGIQVPLLKLSISVEPEVIVEEALNHTGLWYSRPPFTFVNDFGRTKLLPNPMSASNSATVLLNQHCFHLWTKPVWKSYGQCVTGTLGWHKDCWSYYKRTSQTSHHPVRQAELQNGSAICPRLRRINAADTASKFSSAHWLHCFLLQVTQ